MTTDDVLSNGHAPRGAGVYDDLIVADALPRGCLATVWTGAVGGARGSSSLPPCP